MRRIYSLFLLLLTATLLAKSPPSDISQVDKPATLKVLLVSGADRVFLEAKGRYNLYNLDTNLLIDSGIFGKRGDLFPLDGGLTWGEPIPKIDRIRIVPGDSQSSLLVNGIEYKGCLDIRTFGNRLTIINEIDVESYLSATLTPKFTEKLSPEVAEAVVVTARTNAYYFLREQASALWHVSADKVGYQGYALAYQKPFIDRAIEKTRHIVMIYKGAPFPAYWTENSAGKTTTFSAVFRKEALVPPGVVSPYAAYDREESKWSFVMTKNALASLAGARSITAVDLFCDKDSSKVYALRIKDGGLVHDIPFSKLQDAIGERRLKSNDFTVASKQSTLIFQGYGQGHGMGLCLYSAKKMADRGDNAPSILKTFFPGVELVHKHTFTAK